MHIHSSSTPALTLNITTLTTNNITGSIGTFNSLACIGTSRRPLTPTAQRIYIGSSSAGSAAIELCASPSQYIDVTTPFVDWGS